MKIGLLVNIKPSVLDKELKELVRKADNLTPTLTPIAAELTRRARARFNNKIDPDGKRWLPWADSTKAKYAGQKRTLMLNTKKLRDNTVVVATPRGLRFRFGTWYGKFHEQVNGPIKKKLPRRGFFFSARERRRLSEKDERYVLNAVSQQLFNKRYVKRLK